MCIIFGRFFGVVIEWDVWKLGCIAVMKGYDVYCVGNGELLMVFYEVYELLDSFN